MLTPRPLGGGADEEHDALTVPAEDPAVGLNAPTADRAAAAQAPTARVAHSSPPNGIHPRMPTRRSVGVRSAITPKLRNSGVISSTGRNSGRGPAADVNTHVKGCDEPTM